MADALHALHSAGPSLILSAYVLLFLVPLQRQGGIGCRPLHNPTFCILAHFSMRLNLSFLCCGKWL